MREIVMLNVTAIGIKFYFTVTVFLRDSLFFVFFLEKHISIS